MKITDRQEQILNTIVKEYVELARPISSEFLEKKHDFGIRPAAIRIEMQKLTNVGFLYQPHTSAGRVPTDKGYRFFVDSILEQGIFNFDDGDLKSELLQLQKQFKDCFGFVQFFTKRLAELSSALTISYLFDENIFLKEGWKEIIKEPEFGYAEYLARFFELVDNWQEVIEKTGAPSTMKVYIGSENPYIKNCEFSTIVSSCHFPKKQKGVVAILGPRRMQYGKNIALISSLAKLMEEL